MKARAILTIVALMIVAATVHAQVGSRDEIIVLSISPKFDRLQSIPFKLAFAEGDSSGYQPLQFLEGRTPFTRELRGPHLIVLVTDSTRGEFVEVSLQRITNGKSGTGVSGSGSLNILRAEGASFSYGLPKIVVPRRR